MFGKISERSSKLCSLSKLLPILDLNDQVGQSDMMFPDNKMIWVVTESRIKQYVSDAKAFSFGKRAELIF